ncbi:hypothetical protein GOP47_0003857 [Adiantum capillus-veneris]|uniref:Uncharacterized protein n=1 Tax=Adiantum capillus-veneris TaxID=13818 RepID=A0A9D4V6Y2_ADICA|nr:hypothetical protein GOP47_0003857 [Adiantum capillus-veneris]
MNAEGKTLQMQFEARRAKGARHVLELLLRKTWWTLLSDTSGIEPFSFLTLNYTRHPFRHVSLKSVVPWPSAYSVRQILFGIVQISRDIPGRTLLGISGGVVRNRYKEPVVAMSNLGKLPRPCLHHESLVLVGASTAEVGSQQQKLSISPTLPLQTALLVRVSSTAGRLQRQAASTSAIRVDHLDTTPRSFMPPVPVVRVVRACKNQNKIINQTISLI